MLYDVNWLKLILLCYEICMAMNTITFVAIPNMYKSYRFGMTFTNINVYII